jgi:hypothetical protein
MGSVCYRVGLRGIKRPMKRTEVAPKSNCNLDLGIVLGGMPRRSREEGLGRAPHLGPRPDEAYLKAFGRCSAE